MASSTLETKKSKEFMMTVTTNSPPGSHLGDSVPDVFGSDVFHLAAMQQRLPGDVFNKLAETMKYGTALDASIADVVAGAMKEWALEKGATHFCHWFQPLTGLTAEKHDSFILPAPDGTTLMEFSGKDLIRGEPDASSFPSGSLRESFEARGYTAWDCTSPVFIKRDGNNTAMFIPSAFCAYSGEALDFKTPLLRAQNAIDQQAMRVLRAMGNTTAKHVMVTMGAEQEYFLIDQEPFEKRLDLMQTGRTLFGAPSPKGMAMSVHYFGTIHERVASFMTDVNNELWRMGVAAKTQHNEISPCQYEIAPIFTTANLASDHNQLTMEALQKIAERRGMRCLLHEKPFASLGGSGKHVNLSLMTDEGVNLLDAGRTPHKNKLFLLLLCAIVRGVDRYAPLVRACVADAGNDHRLGAMEAPPAIVSIYLGEPLTRILDQLADGHAAQSPEKGRIVLGVDTLPSLSKDISDRNRTSPLAFIGNRFEFRTAGSALSPARPGYVFCTIVSDVLAEIADELEGAQDVDAAATAIIRRIVCNHKRIIFNGDNYSEEWRKEAEQRGLCNLRDTVDAFSALETDEVRRLFSCHQILSPTALNAQIDIAFQRYAEVLLIEGRTALRIATSQILPAVVAYSGKVAQAVNAVSQAGISAEVYQKTLEEVTGHLAALRRGIQALQGAVEETERIDTPKEKATIARDRILPAMKQTREPADLLETIVDADLWPLPTCADMVFK